MSPLNLVLIIASTTLLGGLVVSGVTPNDHPNHPDHPNHAELGAGPPTGNDYEAGFALKGAGWTAIDVPVTTQTHLRFHLSHDTIDNLCIGSPEGVGIYDEGHHTAVHLWRLGSDPFASGQFLMWMGTPHMALPVLQTGVCGESASIHLEAGETARLVVASTLPGYSVELLGDNVTAASTHHDIALASHPGHGVASPLPTALVAEDSIAPIVAVDREWRSGFDVGPTAFYGLPWLHTEADDPLPMGGFEVIGSIDWGFDGAIEYVADPAPVTWRGALGTTTDWAAIFSAWTQGGHVEGYMSEHTQVGAYATSYQAGASFLSVPLAPAAE